MTDADPQLSPAPCAATRAWRLPDSPRVVPILAHLSALPAPIVLGASGGADSAAALLLLARAGVPTLAVHVHHHLREDADNDARVAQKQADLVGCPFHMVHLPTPDPNVNENTEARARRLRYDVLTSIAQHHNAMVITAHHANDLLETFLMRTARGVGLPRAFGLQHDMWWKNVRVHRPLLTLWKEELRTLLTTTSFPWIEDTSNASDRYERNRLRRALTPLIAHLQDAPHFPDTLAALAREANTLRAADAQAPSLDLCERPRPLRHASYGTGHWFPRAHILRIFASPFQAQTALYHWCRTHDIMPRRDVLHDVIAALWSARRFVRDLHGLQLHVFADGLLLTQRDTQSSSFDRHERTVPLIELPFQKWITVGDHDLFLASRPLDARVYARPLRSGDRYASPHSGRMISVRKRLTKSGVPPQQREKACVILLETPTDAPSSIQARTDNAAHKEEPTIVGCISNPDESLTFDSSNTASLIVHSRDNSASDA